MGSNRPVGVYTAIHYYNHLQSTYGGHMKKGRKMRLILSMLLNIYLISGILVSAHLDSLVKIANLSPKDSVSYKGVIYKNIETIRVADLHEIYRTVWFNF